MPVSIVTTTPAKKKEGRNGRKEKTILAKTTVVHFSINDSFRQENKMALENQKEAMSVMMTGTLTVLK